MCIHEGNECMHFTVSIVLQIALCLCKSKVTQRFWKAWFWFSKLSTMPKISYYSSKFEISKGMMMIGSGLVVTVLGEGRVWGAMVGYESCYEIP